MYRKKSNVKKIVAIILMILVIIFIVMYFINNGKNYNPVTSFFKDVGSGIYKVLVLPFVNESNDSQLVLNTLIEEKDMEIDRLEELLELNSNVTDFEVVNATVINRGINYWFKTITIDKGEKDGIVVGMSVVVNDGLIGKISKTTDSSSEVNLLTDVNENFQVSVKIGEVYGLLKEYEDNLLVIKGIGKYNDIKVGDVVTTSGFSDNFIKGIYIGEVKRIENDQNGVELNVYVESLIDYNEIYYVSVLK